MKNCVRVYRNSQQIEQNQERLESVQSSISTLSTSLGLAGNEVRLKILYLIYEEKKLCVCDLSDVLNMTMPAISQHLKKMREGGVLKQEKVGQTIFYSLTSSHKELFEGFFKIIKNNSFQLSE